jgi:hypothetical protein
MPARTTAVETRRFTTALAGPNAETTAGSTDEG